MKKFSEFILEKKEHIVPEVNKDIIELANYIIDYLTDEKRNSWTFLIKTLYAQFPFLESWPYDTLSIRISSTFMNKTVYLKYNNGVGIFMKNMSKSTLVHELVHVQQSINNPDILLVDYDNQAVLTQIRSFFRKNAHNIELLKSLFYIADNREYEAFTQSFKKMKKAEKVELLSFVLLLKYFNLNNLIDNQTTLRQFLTIWREFYGSGDIPFFDRVRLGRNLRRNNIEINKKELKEFTKKINSKFNEVGTKYIRNLSSQYSDNHWDSEKFMRLLNLAKLNIVRNDFDYVLDLSKNKNIKITPNQTYDITKEWE